MQTAVIAGFLAAAPAPEHAARWVILAGGLLAMGAAAAGLALTRTKAGAGRHQVGL